MEQQRTLVYGLSLKFNVMAKRFLGLVIADDSQCSRTGIPKTKRRNDSAQHLSVDHW